MTPLVATILVLVSNVVLSYLLAKPVSAYRRAGDGDQRRRHFGNRRFGDYLWAAGIGVFSTGQFFKELAVILTVGAAVAADRLCRRRLAAFFQPGSEL